MEEKEGRSETWRQQAPGAASRPALQPRTIPDHFTVFTQQVLPAQFRMAERLSAVISLDTNWANGPVSENPAAAVSGPSYRDSRV